MKSLSLSFMLAASLALSAAPAFAHAHLNTAVPAVGGTVTASPSAIRLTFSEDVEPHFSTIALTGPDGKSVPLGQPATAPGHVLASPVPQPLKPGTYTVTWHVVSVDTHKTQGSFSFTVRP
jgi:methionine-rich copper-binding protein CopC